MVADGVVSRLVSLQPPTPCTDPQPLSADELCATCSVNWNDVPREAIPTPKSPVSSPNLQQRHRSFPSSLAWPTDGRLPSLARPELAGDSDSEEFNAFSPCDNLRETSSSPEAILKQRLHRKFLSEASATHLALSSAPSCPSMPLPPTAHAHPVKPSKSSKLIMK
eukprot:gene9452-10443_t